MKRKEFIKLASTGALGISSLGYISCENQKELFFKLSLAQWSLNKAIRGGEMDPYLFAEKSSELGFKGLEYVNQLYDDVMKSEDKSSAIKEFILKNNQLANDNGVENVLIMIDDEGDLADENEDMRQKAIDNHKLWIDTAAAMNCSSIRLNLYGSKDVETWKNLSIDSLSKLGEYAKGTGINVIVENHGREGAKLILEKLEKRAKDLRVLYSPVPYSPYRNTISQYDQGIYPGDLAIEEKITAILRWNALTMVMKANKNYGGLGGHIASYASFAEVFETGFNHFFKGGDEIGRAHV